MNAIIDAALERSRTVIMTLVLILISGTISYISIPKEAAPDINIPIIYTTVTHRGISPEDAERLLVRPIEQELRAVEGVKEMRAVAFEGGANVILEFDAGFDADQALLDVREQVDIAKPELPADSDEPTVNEVNFSQFPMFIVTLFGDIPERTLLKIADDLKDEIEGIPSVLEVDIGGDRDEQVEIIVDPSLVQSYGLNSVDLVNFFASSNRLVAAGNIDNGKGKFAIKVPGLIETVQEILDFPIKVSKDAVVKLKDIATGRRSFEDATEYARSNGKPAVTLEISKRTGENIIETAERIKEIVEREQQYWPESIRYMYTLDKSEQIKDMLSDLQNSVITAILLVMVVIVAALGIRTGALVGISIPGSFLMGILVLSAAGLTINMVVLFGLILAVGMLVDGTIVITEYADRKMVEGKSRYEAYGLAAKRMAWPVIASTATTLAAFLPLAFWTGVVGEFMKFLPITLLATLTASLFMALIFIPTLGSLVGKPGIADPETMKAIAASEHGDVASLKGFTGKYVKILQKALNMPGKIILATVFMLFAAQILYAKFGNGIEFFPKIEPENMSINIHAKGNLSIDEKDDLVKEVEKLVIGMSDIETVYARTGYTPRGGSEDVVGYIQIEYKDWQERRKSKEIIKEIRKKTEKLAGVYIEFTEERRGPHQGKPIEVEISSRNNALLEPAVNHVRKGMEQLGGLVDIEDTRPLPGIQWEVKVDRAQAAKFGVYISAVGDMIQLITRGLKFSDYRPEDTDDELDIIARYPEKYRSIEELGNVHVATQAGSVPISSFVKITAEPKVSNINRTDSKRVMSVKTDIDAGILADNKVKELTKWLEENPLPKDVSIKFKGEDEEQKKSQKFLVKAFGVALFIMAIILVTQFNSFYSAFLILSAVIMSTIGVMLGLLITGNPFGIIMSGIGVISLAGIVVNNNIVLIDTYDRLREEFDSAKEAALRTGIQRLRPVMLTTITTILGLLPMALALNIDFVNRDVTIGAPSMQWWSQLSIAIVSGLTFATVLTLIVTPCALMAKEELIDYIKSKFAK